MFFLMYYYTLDMPLQAHYFLVILPSRKMKKPIQKVVSSLVTLAILAPQLPFAHAMVGISAESCTSSSCFTTGTTSAYVVSRYGDNKPTSGAYELAVFDAGSSVADATENVGWKSGEFAEFTTKYDPQTGILRHEVAGKSVSYTTKLKNKKFSEIVLY